MYQSHMFCYFLLLNVFSLHCFHEKCISWKIMLTVICLIMKTSILKLFICQNPVHIYLWPIQYLFNLCPILFTYYHCPFLYIFPVNLCSESMSLYLISESIMVLSLGQLVCRIEEEHLWESKQLGAHSPHVLLNTLVYFNTKYFMLHSAEDHLKLSFTHIMKHWKKSPPGKGNSAGRSVFLRYYCPTPLKTSSE